MRAYYPHIIKEGGLNYQIGKLEGNTVFYDFDRIWMYLDAKGKKSFGDHFRLYKGDRELIYKLVNYFVRDLEVCKKYGLDIHKGIMLTGPIGCGKTSLMKLMRHITPHLKPYEVIPCRNIAFGYNHIGCRTIEGFGDSGYYCFDDLGIEQDGKHYGKDCNVMGEILLSRYDLFIGQQLKTHVTTNLDSDEIEGRYGNRVRSRMREMFNIVAFDIGSGDKRK
ncbi:ATPase [Galbibacter sp. BG1]|uniref:ATPase n=1 Tax=Galbibacter sp. BG1 TaxID=1170699 RepID=UPI0015BA6A40|nr:ATPase [Galbibacter sp. BG1]QLE02001.1 ATPase [Galbibacter sp. BG1]